MQTNCNQTVDTFRNLSDFVERDSVKQEEMEKELRNFKLEDIESPVYFIFNVNAGIIGF